jgi:hypothetical protein
MIIPEYWAEARVQYRGPKKQVTVRRFGWSNESQAAAQSHADERCNAALQLAIQDAAVPRREQKIPYNGGDGLPIREEVIQREERFVITRNSYGALCINSPDVLFADVDFVTPWKLGCLLNIAWQLAALATLNFTPSYVAAMIAGVVAHSLYQSRINKPEHVLKLALSRVYKFSANFPDWALRIYRTPAGIRILVTHRTFNPREAQVETFFDSIRVDPIYERMCRNQECFRARLTAKPWRIGINAHMRPRPGVWPVHPDRLAIRTAWIENYEAVAAKFAACEFIESLGPHVIQAEVQDVLETHDRLSQANSRLPIA